MKQVKYLLIFLIMIFLNSGCIKSSPKVEYVPVKVMTPIERCHSMEELEPIEFYKLDPEKHIADFYNINILSKNLELLKPKYDLMYSSILCYEKQIKESENKKE